MLYPSTYFDNCNGLVPQIVLCVMLLQAGNEKKLQFPAAFTKDTSDSADWDYSQTESDAKGRLNISGYLPLMESSYLLTKPRLISRISALSPFNVDLLSESVGVPFDTFTNDLPAVVIPAGVPHLSDGELVIETRLAHLLLELEKRNNLYSLYNWLNYTRIAATVKLVSYDASIFGSSIVDTTAPIYGDEVLSLKIINLCTNALFAAYPTLEGLVYGSTASDDQNNRLEEMSAWVQTQTLTGDDRVPYIDSTALYSTISSELETLRYNGVKGIDQISASGDVGSGFSSGGGGGGDSNPEPPSSGGEANPTSPTEDPDRSYGSLSGNAPVNTLPEC